MYDVNHAFCLGENGGDEPEPVRRSPGVPQHLQPVRSLQERDSQLICRFIYRNVL